jgi:general secretion pathway protein B
VSFILDALRKSEHSRQQQTGPGLAEMPVAPSKPRTNVWAAAAIALLVVNLLAVGILLLRRADRQDDVVRDATAASLAGTSAEKGAATAAEANPGTSPSGPDVTAGPVANPTLAPAAPPAASRPRAATPAVAGRNPLADEAGVTDEGQDPELATRAAAVPAGPPAVSSPSRKRGSVQYATETMDGPPAIASAGVQESATPAVAGDLLPTADEITARGSLPALHLDLHVYAPAAAQRFIFVNSRRYREGDSLQEGPLVEAITPDGAVLNLRGSRFKLKSR